MPGSLDYQPRYAVGTFIHETGSQPDMVRVRLYDQHLLPVLERLLDEDELGTLHASRKHDDFAEYTLHRPQDAVDIAARIQLILWHAAYADVERNYPINADALAVGE